MLSVAQVRTYDVPGLSAGTRPGREAGDDARFRP